MITNEMNTHTHTKEMFMIENASTFAEIDTNIVCKSIRIVTVNFLFCLLLLLLFMLKSSFDYTPHTADKFRFLSATN